ncbi:MAG: F0F1 ATP synthase subunit A [Patescibacteria group bacterium]
MTETETTIHDDAAVPVSTETSSHDSAAAAETETTHEVTIFAEPIAHVGGFTITNSLINSWMTVLIIAVLAFVIGKKIRRIPAGLQNAFEIIVEGALKLTDSVTGSRVLSQKVFPFIFSIFLFILVNNWLGLIPGIGSIGFLEMHDGHEVFVPFFRGATADLNTTLALALFSVVASNIFGIIIVGAWKYFNKFINVRALVEVPMKIRKEPTTIFVNPIKFFVGLIEIIGEIAKVASLSFRLFGNVFAGEVLLSSMAVLFAFVLPIPFIFLEVVVGLIQALIFAMLTLVYFSVAAAADEH